MIGTLFTIVFTSLLTNHVMGQGTIVFDSTTTMAPMSSNKNNGMSCSCVAMGMCPTMTPSIDIRIVNTVQKCPDGQVNCCSPSSENVMNASCGIRKIPASSHPEGQASFGAYPWQVALLTTSNVYVGSGVLISPNHVLTVAHKVAPYINGDLKARLGDWDVQSNSEAYPSQEYSVRQIFVHPDYNSVNLQNDVAVLTLNATVPLANSPNINSACLPTALPAANTRCWVSGWGKDAFGTAGKYQSIMKEVDVPIVDQTTCENSLQHTRLGPNFMFDKNSFICAGGESGKDACTGDGGSPLVCQSGTGQWQVVGLVSWGIGCATSNVPGIYVNVYQYIPWITQKMTQNK